MLRLKPSQFYVGPSTKNLRSPLLPYPPLQSCLLLRCFILCSSNIVRVGCIPLFYHLYNSIIVDIVVGSLPAHFLVGVFKVL